MNIYSKMFYVQLIFTVSSFSFILHILSISKVEFLESPLPDNQNSVKWESNCTQNLDMRICQVYFAQKCSIPTVTKRLWGLVVWWSLFNISYLLPRKSFRPNLKRKYKSIYIVKLRPRPSEHPNIYFQCISM